MTNGILMGLKKRYVKTLRIDLPINQWLEDDRRLDEESLVERITDEVVQRYRSRREQMGDETAVMLERHFMLKLAGSPLERSLGGDGLFTSRHSLAWLCTEKS